MGLAGHVAARRGDGECRDGQGAVDGLALFRSIGVRCLGPLKRRGSGKWLLHGRWLVLHNVPASVPQIMPPVDLVRTFFRVGM
jgi:hypothetical protein